MVAAEGEGVGAQRGADRARRATGAGERDLLAPVDERLLPAPGRVQGQRQLCAPWYEQWSCGTACLLSASTLL